MRRLTGPRWLTLPLLAAAIAFMGVTRVPAALAFPHQVTIGSATVLSDTPIDATIGSRLARADALVTAAGLIGADRPHRIVLTDGGWRWRVLSVTAAGAFGLRRPFSATLVFNRSDVGRDRVYNRSGRARTLSGTIAHEMAHWLAAERIGELKAMSQPTWAWEGFADHVAQESTLTPAEAARLRRNDQGSAPLAYFDGRRRVEAALAHDPSIDNLFR